MTPKNTPQGPLDASKPAPGAAPLPVSHEAIQAAYEAARRQPYRAGWGLDLVCQPEMADDTTAPLRTGRGQWKLIRFALRQLKPYWHQMIFIFIGMTVMAMFKSLYIWPTALIIDYALPDQNWTMFWIAVAMALGVWILLTPGVIFRWPHLIAMGLRIYLLTIIRTHLRIHFFRHLHRLSLRFFQRRPVGEHMYRAVNDVDMTVGLIAGDMNSIPAFIQAILDFIWLLLLVGLMVNSTVAGILMLYMIPYLIIFHLLASWIRRVDRRVRAREQTVNAVLQEGVSGVQTVKAFARQRHELRKFINRHCVMYRQRMLWAWLSELRTFLFGFILTPGVIPWVKTTGLTIWAYYLVVTGEITFGKALVLVYWVDALTWPLGQIVTEFQAIRAALIPLERVFETMSIEPLIQDDPKAPKAPPIRGEIEFDNVHFSYVPPTEVLKGLSFKIKPGETVGIVGPSGAGKSTLAKLALRLYDPDSGAVRIDGYDLRSVQYESVQSQIGTVIQETYLFEGTIREQLLFSNPRASEQDIRDAVEAADLTEFIENLPEKYDTNLAEGTRISGGQKQRIGIARALIRKPQLLILDEPTASLDSSTEAEVMQTLWKAMEGRTSLIISHRLALVRQLDRIVVIDDGRMVQQGSHDELLARGGLYAELWQEQFGEAERKATTCSSRNERPHSESGSWPATSSGSK